MKRLFIWVVMLVAGGGHLCQARQSFMAILNSANEMPPNDLSSTEGTYAVGYFNLTGMTLDVTGGFYDYSYPVSEISLYDGPVTLAGPPLFELNVDPDASAAGGGFFDGTFSGSVVLTGGEVTDLKNNYFNLNVQTPMTEMEGLPGEMSGAIKEIPEPGTMMLMGVGLLAWLMMPRRKSDLAQVPNI